MTPFDICVMNTRVVAQPIVGALVLMIRAVRMIGKRVDDSGWMA